MANNPSTGLLSEFLDPPENPLREGGKWLPVFPNGVPGTTVTDMRKEGGQATDLPHGAVLNNHIAYSYYTLQQFEGDAEVWGFPVGGQLGAALETWRLFMFETLDPPTGYLVYIGGGIGKDTTLRIYDGNSFTGLGSEAHVYTNALMLRTNGPYVEVWANDTDQTFDDPSKWYLRIQATDGTYRGPFYIGMGIEDPTGGGLGWDAIGGGIPHRTQIYRILSALT